MGRGRREEGKRRKIDARDKREYGGPRSGFIVSGRFALSI